MVLDHADMNDKPEENSPWRHVRTGAELGNTDTDPDCCRMMQHSPQSVPSLSPYYGIIQPPKSPTASSYVIPMMKTMPLQKSSGLGSGFVLMQSPGHVMSPGLGQFVPVVPVQAISFNENYSVSGGPGESDMSSGLHQSPVQTDLMYSLGPPLAPSSPRSSRQLENVQSPGLQNRPLQSRGKLSSNYTTRGSGQFEQSPPPNDIPYEPSGPLRVGSPSSFQRPVSSISPIPSSQQATQLPFPPYVLPYVHQQTGPNASRPMSSSSSRPLSPMCPVPSTTPQANLTSQPHAYRQSTASLRTPGSSYQTIYSQSPASPQSPINSYSCFPHQSSSNPQRHVPAQPSTDIWNSTQSPRRPDCLNYPYSQQPVRRLAPTRNWTSGYASDSSELERSHRYQSPPSKVRSQSPPVKGIFQGTYYVSDGRITFNPPLNLSSCGNSSLSQGTKDSPRFDKKEGIDVENAQALPDGGPNTSPHKCVQTPLEWIIDMTSKNIQTPCGWLGGPTVNEPPSPLQYCSGSCPTSKNMGHRRKRRRRVCCDSCKAEIKKRKDKIKSLEQQEESEFDGSSVESGGQTKTGDSIQSIHSTLETGETATSPTTHLSEQPEAQKTPSTQTARSAYPSMKSASDDFGSVKTSPSENLQENNVNSQSIGWTTEPIKTID